MSSIKSFCICIIALGLAACFDFSDEPLGEKDYWCKDDGSCNAGLICNDKDHCIDPCEDVRCSGHGGCIIQLGNAVCSCDSDFVPVNLECLEIGSKGTPCGPSFSCRTGLTCDSGFCVDACSQRDCGHGSCQLVDEKPACNCEAGYHEARDTCVDACDGIECSGHGRCQIETGAVCACDSGYQASGPNCVVPGCVPTSHTDKQCYNGSLYWFDSCGTREDVSASCGTRGCTSGACAVPQLFGLGGSESGLFGGGTTWQDMDVDSGGRPTVARIGASTVFADRWNGTAWSAYQTQSGKQYIDIALDASGAPYAVQTANNSTSVDSDLAVTAWNTAWAAIPTGSSGIAHMANKLSNPSIALSSSNVPTIGWLAVAPGGNQFVYVKQFNGSSWVGLASSDADTGVSGQTGYATRVQIRVGADGQPVVAWTRQAGGVYVKRWSGTAWEEFAGSGQGLGISNGGGYDVGLTLDGNNPVVAYVNSGVVTKRWNGTAWVNLASGANDETVINPTAYPRAPGISSPSPGVYVTHWWGIPSAYVVYAYLYEDGAWQPLGDAGVIYSVAAASSGPILNTVGASGNGRACLSWRNAPTNGQDYSFVKCVKP